MNDEKKLHNYLLINFFFLLGRNPPDFGEISPNFQRILKKALYVALFLVYKMTVI